MRQASWVLAVALVAAGCAAPATPGAGAPSVAQALATGKVAAAILAQPSLKRVARSFQDPAAGKPFKVSQYWDYEPGTPFEIEDAVVTTASGTDGAKEVSLSADVKLPTGKALKFHLLQDEGGDSSSDDSSSSDGDSSSGDSSTSDGDSSSGDSSTSGGDSAGGDSSTSGGDTPGDDSAGEGQDGAEGDSQADEVAEAPEPAEDLAGAETDEEISPEADDVAWADDYLLDGDEDGELDEGEAALYQEAFDEEAEDKILMAPHKVSLRVQDRPTMGGGMDLVRIKDEKTGKVLEIRHDQNWDRFELSSGSRKLEVMFQPDGSYLIDGQAAGGVDEVVGRLQAHPMVKAAGPHAWSILAGRLGRLPQEAQRVPPSAPSRLYKLLGTAGSDVRRAFLLVDSLVAKLVLGK